MGKPKHKPSTVVIPPELKEEIKNVMQTSNQNFSEIVCEALNDWLNKQ
jgi:hypothetical protein